MHMFSVPHLTNQCCLFIFLKMNNFLMGCSYPVSFKIILFCSGLPHLAVSSSTPPPATSPLPVKIKSEPISPPRDGSSHSHSLGHPLSHLQAHGHGHTSLPRPNSTGHLTPTPGKYCNSQKSKSNDIQIVIDRFFTSCYVLQSIGMIQEYMNQMDIEYSNI